jgi:membrane-anchored protein YejM (alkaline phosphatase superfamily)
MDWGSFNWSLLTIVGPALLFIVILYATLKNRKSRREDIERTERATHELYQEEDAAHRKRSDVIP